MQYVEGIGLLKKNFSSSTALAFLRAGHNGIPKGNLYLLPNIGQGVSFAWSKLHAGIVPVPIRKEIHTLLCKSSYKFPDNDK